MIEPLLFAATVGAWVGARALYTRVPRIYFHPVVVAALPLTALLALSPVAASSYSHATRPLGWLLGPAVVGFATQLFARRDALRRGGFRLAAVFICAAISSIFAAAGFARLFGASDTTVRSLIPASSTSPIAASVAEADGGRGTVAIAACMVIGLAGAVLGPLYARRLRLGDDAYGAALGISAHGIGTGAAVDHSEASGASAGLALVVQGLLVAALAPLGYAVFSWLR